MTTNKLPDLVSKVLKENPGVGVEVGVSFTGY